MSISDELQKAIDEYGEVPFHGWPTSNKRAALVAAIEQEVEAAKRSEFATMAKLAREVSHILADSSKSRDTLILFAERIEAQIHDR